MTSPKWHALWIGEGYNPRVVEQAKVASGAYALRDKSTHEVLYVGESSRGTIWKTILRHVQAPDSFRRVRESGVLTKHPSNYEVAIHITSRGARPRASSKRKRTLERRGVAHRTDADQKAMAVQARWIKWLKPKKNLDDGLVVDELRAVRARQEEEDREGGAFDSFLNPGTADGHRGRGHCQKCGLPKRLTKETADTLPLIVEHNSRGKRCPGSLRLRMMTVEELNDLKRENEGNPARAFDEGMGYETAGREALRKPGKRHQEQGIELLRKAFEAYDRDEFLGGRDAGLRDGAGYQERHRDRMRVQALLDQYVPRVPSADSHVREVHGTEERVGAFSIGDDVLVSRGARGGDDRMTIRYFFHVPGFGGWKAQVSGRGGEGSRNVLASELRRAPVVKSKSWDVPKTKPGVWNKREIGELKQAISSFWLLNFRSPDGKTADAERFYLVLDAKLPEILEAEFRSAARMAEERSRKESEAAVHFAKQPIDATVKARAHQTEMIERFDDLARADRHGAAIAYRMAQRAAFETLPAEVLTFDPIHPTKPRASLTADEATALLKPKPAKKPAPPPAGYGEEEKTGKKRGQLRMFNPAPEGALTELGKLTRLEGARGLAMRWSLREAPALAYDDAGRLFIVYMGRIVRSSTPAEMREYGRTHWGKSSKGHVRDGGVAPPGQFKRLGAATSITYTTQKGFDSALVDYVHPFGEGASLRGFVPPQIVEHECSKCGPRCAARGAIALQGGTYRVTSRGIVG